MGLSSPFCNSREPTAPGAFWEYNTHSRSRWLPAIVYNVASRFQRATFSGEMQERNGCRFPLGRVCLWHVERHKLANNPAPASPLGDVPAAVSGVHAGRQPGADARETRRPVHRPGDSLRLLPVGLRGQNRLDARRHRAGLAGLPPVSLSTHSAGDYRWHRGRSAVDWPVPAGLGTSLPVARS